MLQPVFQEIFGDPQLSYVEIVVRPKGALILARMIGFNLESESRPAGLRTHTLISLSQLAEKNAETYRKTHADVSQQAESENG